MENECKIFIDDALIARYLAGEATPEEAVAVHTWLEAPANRRHFQELGNAWHSTRPSAEPRSVNAGAAWSLVQARMRKGRTVRRKWEYFAVAASITLFITAGLWYFGQRTDAHSNSIVITTRDTVRHIYLSDKSVVTLNAQTTFSHPGSFEDRTREVNLLHGEGFFDIAPDATRPFIIHTSFGDIKVVGTAFNVVVTDARLEVGVKQGKVMLSTEYDTVLVGPGFTAEITSAEKTISMAADMDVNDWSYATGLLVFQDTPLEKVIGKIKKSHSVYIEIANPNIYKCRLTATFENVTAENMIYLMAETLNLSVERNGKNFILKGKGCP